MFNHPVNIYQWMGIALVFLGLGLEIGINYIQQPQNNITTTTTTEPAVLDPIGFERSISLSSVKTDIENDHSAVRRRKKRE